MSNEVNNEGNQRVIDSIVSIVRNAVQQQRSSTATNDDEPSDFSSVLVATRAAMRRRTGRRNMRGKHGLCIYHF